MWVKSLILKNVRSFKNAQCEFSKSINILIGPNNAGKSTILLPLLGLQEGLPQLSTGDIRLGASESEVEIVLGDYTEGAIPNAKSIERLWYDGNKQRNTFALMGKFNGNAQAQMNKMSNKEPTNFIYPYVAKRKVVALQEQINQAIVEAVPPTFENLYAKIDRLSDSEFQPANSVYMRACDQILGFRITSAHTSNGKRAVYTVHNMQRIPLSAMGEGVTNILGLVVHLAIAEGQLFLIEEPENDVHPKALKGLMDLIVEKSQTNQFILTTHSNIVLKKLGANPDTKIFQIESGFEQKMPTSTVSSVGPNYEDRRKVLQDLGYEFNDANLWDAWLFLEESSAERIIRDYLIPWFVPSLRNRLRTFSAHSLSEVEPRFKDFNELFVFLHLEPIYKNRAWVLVDGGSNEETIINQLKLSYSKSGWDESRFRQFSRHQFEDYYPAIFFEEVQAVKAMDGKKEKRHSKQVLLDKVLSWVQENEVDAKASFATSASEVIEFLEDVERALDQRT